MNRIVLMLLATVIVACGNHSDSTTTATSSGRYTNTDQHYAVDQPDGWTVAMEHGAARFAPSQPTAKHTIVIRSALRPSEIKEGQPTTHADVIVATGRVLEGLPRANMEKQSAVDMGALLGERFSVTFLPNGVAGRYRRTQVTLVGKTRVFHVIYTAPESEDVDEPALQLMVSTLEEKV